MRALIGYTGFIGGVLQGQIRFDLTFNSVNINDLPEHNIDILYCAAPTGSRMYASEYPAQDLENTNKLIETLEKSNIKKFILIGTVDSIHALNTSYGRNRKMLEDFVKFKFKDYHIVRLCSLIHSDIKKNVLYDLKHKKYLNKINKEQVNQWYPLDRLHSDIQKNISMNIRESNFVSEPISNLEIINNLYPGLDVGYCKNTEPYNLKCCDTVDYLISKTEIFKEMEKYIGHAITK